MIMAVLRKSRIVGSISVIDRIAAGAAGPGNCGPSSETPSSHSPKHMEMEIWNHLTPIIDPVYRAGDTSRSRYTGESSSLLLCLRKRSEASKQ